MIPTKFNQKSSIILIDALYICQTGGNILLDLLLNRIDNEDSKDDIIFLIDKRIKKLYLTKQFQKIKLLFLIGSEICRYKFYLKNRYILKKVFCFANIPPPIRLNCMVITYFHNVLLLDNDLQKYFPFNNRILFMIKGRIIKMRSKHTDNWLVQTQHVKDLLVANSNINSENIIITPFFNDNEINVINEPERKEIAFFYPAIDVPHKNIEILLNVWDSLYTKYSLKSPLHLTIHEDSKTRIYSKLVILQKRGVPIINHGYLSKIEVDKLYEKCKFVIHPSLGESFGLVLIEAIKNKCILLAPDSPYVNDIVIPNYYFNVNKTDTIEKSILNAIFDENYPSSKILVKSEIAELVKCIFN